MPALTNTSLATLGTEVYLDCEHLNASNASQIKTQLMELIIAPWCDGLIVDMAGVELLDSSGLMALVTILSVAQQMDKRFVLRGVSASIQIIFELTQLDRVFEFVPA